VAAAPGSPDGGHGGAFVKTEGVVNHMGKRRKQMPGTRLSTIALLAVLGCASLFPTTVAAAGAVRGRLIATDFADLHAAVAALPGGTGEIYLPPGNYVLEKPLDLSHPSGGYRGGIKLVGAGRMSKIIGRTPGQPVIDLTGANHCLLQDLNIESGHAKAEEAPSIGLLLARNADSRASQEHRFTNVNIIGHFTLANVYNITSELNRFIGCIFINRAPGGHNLVWSSDNFAGVESPYQGAIRTLYSNTELRLIGCSFYNWGRGEGGSNLHLRGFTMDTTVRDCYMNPPRGGYAVFMGMSSKRGPVRGIEFDAVRIEGENAASIFKVEGRAENVTIRNSSILYGRGPALEADALHHLNLCHNDIWNIRNWKTALKIEYLYDSRVVDNLFTFDAWGGDTPEPGPVQVLAGRRSERNLIQVPTREHVYFKTIRQTLVEAVAEQGVRRRYTGTIGEGLVYNLVPVDTARLEGMKRGDLAVDDGSNTQSGHVGLAVYDGRVWQYMN
jgi:hypothetical protein